MFSELQTWAIISVVGVIWLALILVGGISGNVDQFKVITDVVPILLILAGTFERWGWRWSKLHPHLVKVPVLRGTWKGELESLWEDPVTRARPPKKTVYFTVEQTLTSICVRLLSDESASEQVAGTIDGKSSGRYVVSAIYLNTPTIDKRATSPIHYGGLALAVYGRPPRRLEGEYWTERQSKGKLLFDKKSSVIAQTFDEADDLSFA
jgi:SMODS-associating 2TM, beta-strand rich effector domain